ncbi:hypothetical protein DY000_02026509 [Brassica cretica]|uniref:Uncharacterized protein n=1 Tax=Brassica cretica TaxID=69181 RepID=A0ABQ7E885_BRACR|nr:hypothetical protein DY000_02026509 [Brassica cretica]
MSLSSSILQRNCESSTSDLDMAENRGGGGCCPPMDLMRSQPMLLVQVIVPMESAHLTSQTSEPPPPRCSVFPFLKSVNMRKLRVTSEFDSDSLLFFNKVFCKIFDNLAKLKLPFHNNTQRQVSQPQVSFTSKYVSVLYDVEEKNAFVKSTVDVSPRLQLRALHNVKITFVGLDSLLVYVGCYYVFVDIALSTILVYVVAGATRRATSREKASSSVVGPQKIESPIQKLESKFDTNKAFTGSIVEHTHNLETNTHGKMQLSFRVSAIKTGFKIQGTEKVEQAVRSMYKFVWLAF